MGKTSWCSESLGLKGNGNPSLRRRRRGAEKLPRSSPGPGSSGWSKPSGWPATSPGSARGAPLEPEKPAPPRSRPARKRESSSELSGSPSGSAGGTAGRRGAATRPELAWAPAGNAAAAAPSAGDRGGSPLGGGAPANRRLRRMTLLGRKGSHQGVHRGLQGQEVNRGSGRGRVSIARHAHARYAQPTLDHAPQGRET